MLNTQQKVVKLMTASNRTKLFQTLAVIDDCADDPVFTRPSKQWHSLYARGRCSSISTIASAMKFAAIHPRISVCATNIIVYCSRNNRDIESFLEEVSGLSRKNELLFVYKFATETGSSFLYFNLSARKVSEMFFDNVTGRIELEHVSDG